MRIQGETQIGAPTLARLHAALDAVENTRSLIGELRQVGSFRSDEPELRSVADLVAAARQALRVLIEREAVLGVYSSAGSGRTR